MAYKIQRKIKSDISQVKYVVDDILSNLQENLNHNAFFNTKLILSELIINGVKHGNLGDMSKLLNICVHINNNSLIIEVSDEGSGIKFKHKTFGEYDFDDTGRGLMLVEGLSDEFTICGNTVKCVQYLK
ncbi:MAG: ATP-binding protein [Tissierellia bacterium]|nr:ATP-binding protein [Tissierellia bacterium]MDD4779831.1 ATP-binding protein [Tissierellia bacterium]